MQLTTNSCPLQRMDLQWADLASLCAPDIMLEGVCRLTGLEDVLGTTHLHIFLHLVHTLNLVRLSNCYDWVYSQDSWTCLRWRSYASVVQMTPWLKSDLCKHLLQCNSDKNSLPCSKLSLSRIDLDCMMAYKLYILVSFLWNKNFL